jgi:hypothetical protein
MGAAQSRNISNTVASTKLTERSRHPDRASLPLQQKLEKDYCFIEDEKYSIHEIGMWKVLDFYRDHADGKLVAVALGHALGSPSVSISTAEEWQKEVMADPKVAHLLHSYVAHIC